LLNASPAGVPPASGLVRAAKRGLAQTGNSLSLLAHSPHQAPCLRLSYSCQSLVTVESEQMRFDRLQAKRYLALAAFTGSFLFILGVIVLESF
jgi:hypothetical protein